MNQNLSFVLLIWILLWSACNNQSTAPTVMPPRPYPVVPVVQRDVITYDEYPTTIQGKINNDVRSKIQGYIREVYVDEGQLVKRGDRLFRVETATLDQTAAANTASVEVAEANIASAQSAIEVAEVEVNRLRPLVDKGIISEIQLKTAEANLAAARSNLNQAQAAKSQAEANLQTTRANIGYSIISAPIDGMVGAIPYREGSLVGPTDMQPLTLISDTKDLYAYFSMNESAYLNFLSNTEGSTLQEKIAHFPKVSLRLANGQIYPEDGQIETVTGRIDPRTGTIQFRALFGNDAGLLTSGNTGTIRIPNLHEKVLVIPESATADHQGNITAYRVQNDTAYAQTLQIAGRANNLVIVTSGLSNGDHVVAQGLGSIQNRTAITPQLTTTDSLIQQIKPIFR